MSYEWRFCPDCHGRIFQDEVEGDTIKTVAGTLYCIDCAKEREELGAKYHDNCTGDRRETGTSQ